MIIIDFFGCRREQIVSCSWSDACERFSSVGINIPDGSALLSLGQVLDGTAFSAELVPASHEPFYELCKALTSILRTADEDYLLDAGARWACLPPWTALDINAMDLAGFLLQLHSLVANPENAENSIFLWTESGLLPDA
jgi:hypothetical protein